MTASDFHRALRNLLGQNSNEPLQFNTKTISETFGTAEEMVREHLKTLHTLGLVEYVESDADRFFLTESGKLSNLP